ncbi:hypothetical protein [Motiliproteus sp. SC1-56]|uniref:hypothetical protein n=1 Tax=Motiliproteus sp. SC1-56 TaxID=2799565 RepID=UPI001A8D7900|nr:hypothetical protein [Motiliproteus sp. SC1-56]
MRDAILDPLPTRLAGIFISAALGLVILGLLGAEVSVAWAGTAYWIAALGLWPRLTRRNRIQSLVLMGVGLGCLFWVDQPLDAERLLAGNAPLLSMLVAVSFLGLVSQPPAETEALPRGRGAVASTLLGVHLFGAVINLSSIFIIADRIGRRHTLGADQAKVLVRGFSAAAFWSPFFAAMGVALSVAPEARLQQVWSAGIPLAALALGISYWSMRSRAPAFVGYPMHYRALWLPALLALGVVLMRYVDPQRSIIGTITLLAPGLALLVLPLQSGRALRLLGRHLGERLPQMGNELLLFQAAAVLGYGLETLILSQPGWALFEHFGGGQASLTYLAITGLSLLGVHPIISIALAGSLLAPLAPDHTLLAVVFLAAWGMGSAVGPLSGMNLAIQGRYGIEALSMSRWNLGYTAVMSLLICLALYGLAAWRGLGVS